ncbi:hypothetical protein SAMN05216188_11149 [Lentzea xinjiangensis]|uniref:Uncharacterized protein n=1 Tax=Lentzea xinjiangensis TaxID=402600 RepID=A0A1H9NYL6_9PSEU|nr:hypothetical protein [Lentzea xinjiangensis]SER40679.1 hypothetical protein SAMN05216188_11149 [Lentzea xinjiangensis]
MDDNGPGCVAVLAGLSTLIYAIVSFGYFRQGFEELGTGETWSWLLAVLGSLVLVAAITGLGAAVRADPGCLGGLGLFAAAGALLAGHHLVVRQGDAPRWVLDPPTPAEWFWDDPPRWAEITQWIVLTVVGVAVAMAATSRR